MSCGDGGRRRCVIANFVGRPKIAMRCFAAGPVRCGKNRHNDIGARR